MPTWRNYSHKSDQKAFLPSQRYVYTRLLIHLFECSLGEEMTLDPGQSLVRIVVRLLNQTQLFTLGLV